MIRTTRRALIHALLFLSALTLIIYLGRPTPAGKRYPWLHILYQPTSSTLPEPRGLCPGLLSSTSKPVLVVARLSTDPKAWLSSPELLEKYLVCVYTMDLEPSRGTRPGDYELQVPANRGHEAMAYLTFIIDNYQKLRVGTAVVFAHGSRRAWHNDHSNYDNLSLLLTLDISRALGIGAKEEGYHNLRCDWSVSTCARTAAPQGSLEISVQARLSPWDTRAVSDAALPLGFAQLFGPDGRLGRGDRLRAQCCAQFVVSAVNIRQHSREEYVGIRQWLLETAPGDDKVAGRILSYLWHVLFLGRMGEKGVDLEELNRRACPSAQECYCKLYGRCGLRGCGEGGCVGEYVLPPSFKVEDMGDEEV